MEVLKDCLFDKGAKCSILKKKQCEKCKFFVEDTIENKIRCIDEANEAIKRYATGQH